MTMQVSIRLGLVILIASLGTLLNVPQARATPACQAQPGLTLPCTLDGQTFSSGGSSGDGLTFLADFTTPNQNNSSIAELVTDFLTLLGDTNVPYLGRQDGSGLIDGDNVSATPSGGLTGTWTFTPGTTGDVGAFVAIHAGSGQDDILYQINSPGTSGTWATMNGHGLSNFDLFGEDPPASVPEPASLALLEVGLVGLGLIRRRKHVQ